LTLGGRFTFWPAQSIKRGVIRTRKDVL
jgi:hypothetical protein